MIWAWPPRRFPVRTCAEVVLSSCQVHGETDDLSESYPYTAEDPPCCYLRTKNYPGTAFTRSIGDSVAESIGVIATPEVEKYRIREEDRFIIVASDGVWEFLSSHEAVDIVSACSDPHEAAQKLIDESWKLWHAHAWL